MSKRDDLLNRMKPSENTDDGFLVKLDEACRPILHKFRKRKANGRMESYGEVATALILSIPELLQRAE